MPAARITVHLSSPQRSQECGPGGPICKIMAAVNQAHDAAPVYVDIAAQLRGVSSDAAPFPA